MEKQCQFIKKDGNRCSGFTIDDSLYCLSHDPSMSEARIVRAKKGGSAESYEKLNLKLEPVSITSSTDVMKIVVKIINELRSGTIPPRIATSIGYLLGIALKAFELGEIEERIKNFEKAIYEHK